MTNEKTQCSHHSSGRILININNNLSFLLLLVSFNNIILVFFGRLVEATNRQVIDNLLHLLQVVLDPVKLLPQVVILQIEQPGLIGVS